MAVLDDDRDFRFGVARALRGLDFLVEEAEDTAGLAALLARTHVDVIVADSRLADGSDGWREALALANRYPHVRVVAITAYPVEAIKAFEGMIVTDPVQKSDGPQRIVEAVIDAFRE